MRRLATGLALITLAMPPAVAQSSPSNSLPPGPGAELVAAHCGSCHSLGLVTQNRGDAAHWRKLIRWMQAEHNLWDLGPAEQPILDYLSKALGAPARAPRRAALEVDWYGAEQETAHEKRHEQQATPKHRNNP